MPLAVKLLNTGKGQDEAAQEAAQIKEAHDTNWWTTRLTLAAVGIGFLQLIAFVVQAVVLAKTVAVMRSANVATEKAVEAARKGADAAEGAVRQAEIANAVSQRAYLHFSGVRLWRYPENKIEITYPICNAGQTPGRFTGEFTRAGVYRVGVFRSRSSVAK